MVRRLLFAGYLTALVVWGQQQGAPRQGGPPQTEADQAITRIPPVRPFVLPPRIGVITDKELTLEDALAMALANNKDIDGSRIDRDKAINSVSGAKGSFDPKIGGVTSFQKTVTPVASTLGGSASGAVTSRNSLADPQFSGSLPWLGNQLSAGFLLVAHDHQQQFYAAQPAVSDVAEFLLHAAAVAQPALRR